MLNILFASENILSYNDKEVEIRINANFFLKVVSKKGVGYELHFTRIRINGMYFKDGKIAEVRTLQKVRELIAKFHIDKQYAIRLAMRYADPIVMVSRIIDPLGFLVKDGNSLVNGLRQSEMASMQAQGYTFLLSNKDQSSNEMSIRVKKAKRVNEVAIERKR